MASSSSFIGGRARSGSIEDERNNNFEYNKGIINIDNIKPLPSNDPYKSPAGQYRVASDNDFRGNLAPQDDYRVNSADYRGNTPATDFNRNITVDYRNDLRSASSNSYDYRAYRDIPTEYKNEFRTCASSTEDISGRGNSSEYSPGGTRISTGASGGYPTHFWNYIGGLPSRR